MPELRRVVSYAAARTRVVIDPTTPDPRLMLRKPAGKSSAIRPPAGGVPLPAPVPLKVESFSDYTEKKGGADIFDIPPPDSHNIDTTGFKDPVAAKKIVGIEGFSDEVGRAAVSATTGFVDTVANLSSAGTFF